MRDYKHSHLYSKKVPPNRWSVEPILTGRAEPARTTTPQTIAILIGAAALLLLVLYFLLTGQSTPSNIVTPPVETTTATEPTPSSTQQDQAAEQTKQEKETPVKTAPVKPAKDDEEKSANDGHAPHYSFYDVLPQMEVEIPSEILERSNITPAERHTLSLNRQAGEHFVIQLGAYTAKADAQRAVQTLRAEGISVSILESASPSGKTFYKLRTEPILNTESLKQVRNQATALGFPILILKTH